MCVMMIMANNLGRSEINLTKKNYSRACNNFLTTRQSEGLCDKVNYDKFSPVEVKKWSFDTIFSAMRQATNVDQKKTLFVTLTRYLSCVPSCPGPVNLDGSRNRLLPALAVFRLSEPLCSLRNSCSSRLYKPARVQHHYEYICACM